MKRLNTYQFLFANMLLSSSMAYGTAAANPAAAKQMQLITKAVQAEQQKLTFKQAEYLLNVVAGSADITASRFPAPGEKLKTQAKKRENEYNITGMHHFVAPGLFAASPMEQRRNLVLILKKCAIVIKIYLLGSKENKLKLKLELLSIKSRSAILTTYDKDIANAETTTPYLGINNDTHYLNEKHLNGI